jgi:DNA topoisomerase VI subunit B
MTAVLERTVFATSRAAEFLQVATLQTLTGQPSYRFADVVLKELLDNALDACEAAEVEPHITVMSWLENGLRRLMVADNGTGIPASVVDGILDFSVLVSDKAPYRAPTRGAQGNALKTIVGIPASLGVCDPVIIEAHGMHHRLSVTLDPGGNVVVNHEIHMCQQTAGTSVTVSLPAEVEVDVTQWVPAYAAVNPHAHLEVADLAESDDEPWAETYKPTAPEGWSKPGPRTKTSAWWYDEAAFAKLVYAHIGAARQGGKDLPLGEFILQFDRLSAPPKVAKVRAKIPGVTHLSGFTDRPQQIGMLLAHMKEATTPPKPAVLGKVPAKHREALLDRLYGVEQAWSARRELLHDGVPWAVEVTVARTHERGRVVFATNYSAAFSDPLARARLATADTSVTGAESFLYRTDAHPSTADDGRRAAIIHVICAAPHFLDRGKTQLDVPAEVATECAAALEAATKGLATEKRRRERDGRREANRQERERKAAERPKMTLKEAVFLVMQDAIAAQVGGTNLSFSARSLFYKVRPRIQQHTTRELIDSYFTQTLLPEYQATHGPISGLYYEPRGDLHHPHDPDGHQSIPLGTREVSTYTPPDWTYDKVLVVEKAGLWPTLKDARIADRYDMAVITSEGFAVEACRALLASLNDRDVTVFALHDADPAGYNIARTLGEETRRMPGHHVEVIDLGLTIADAISLDLEPEAFTRRKALPERIAADLDELETEWFGGRACHWDHRRQPNQWSCKRVELNALSNDQLIAYIEDGLALHGATGKVVPPQPLVRAEADGKRREILRQIATNVLDELLDIERLIDDTAGVLATEYSADVTRDDVEDDLDSNPHQSWRDSAANLADRQLSAIEDEIRHRARALYATRGIGGQR